MSNRRRDYSTRSKLLSAALARRALAVSARGAEIIAAAIMRRLISIRYKSDGALLLNSRRSPSNGVLAINDAFRCVASCARLLLRLAADDIVAGLDRGHRKEYRQPKPMMGLMVAALIMARRDIFGGAKSAADRAAAMTGR